MKISEKIKWSNNPFLVWLTFFRPINGICAAYGVFVVVLLTGHVAGIEPDLYRVVLGSIVTFLFTCAIIGHHDFYDKADIKTHPWRGLHRGAINRSTARAVVIEMFVICIIMSYLIGIYIFILMVALMFIGIWYNRYAKYQPYGLFVVSICTAAVVPFGSVLATPREPLILLPFFLGLLCSEICREAGNYCQDSIGDGKGGSKTLPVMIGRKKTMYVGLIFLILAVIPFLSHHFGWFGAVLINNGMYLIGGVGYLVLLSMAWVNCNLHLNSENNEDHIFKVFEYNWRYAGRFYLILILQPLMLAEIFF